MLQAAGITVPADAAATTAGGTLVVVAGPDGSPGRSTVAINVAAALGVHRPTVLVDANLVEPRPVGRARPQPGPERLDGRPRGPGRGPGALGGGPLR